MVDVAGEDDVHGGGRGEGGRPVRGTPLMEMEDVVDEDDVVPCTAEGAAKGGALYGGRP